MSKKNYWGWTARFKNKYWYYIFLERLKKLDFIKQNKYLPEFGFKINFDGHFETKKTLGCSRSS